MPTAAIITFIAGSLLTLYLGILELRKENKSWSKIWILLILFCVFLGVGLYDILLKDDNDKNGRKEIIESNNTSSQKVKDAIDSTRNVILDSIKQSSKNLKDNLAKSIRDNSPKVEKTAFIDLAPMEQNPQMVYTQNQDSLKYTIDIKNFGNDVALNIIDKIIIVTYLRGKPNFDNKGSFRITNKSTSLHVKEQVYITIKIHAKGKNIKLRPVLNPTYVYFKLTYTNSENKKMRPLKKIFYIKDNESAEVGSIEYDKVEKDLKANGLY